MFQIYKKAVGADGYKSIIQEQIRNVPQEIDMAQQEALDIMGKMADEYQSQNKE